MAFIFSSNPSRERLLYVGHLLDVIDSMGVKTNDFDQLFRVALVEMPDLVKEYLGMHITQMLMDDCGFRAVFANQGDVACAYALLGFRRIECTNVVRVLYSALVLQAKTQFHEPFSMGLVIDHLREDISVLPNGSFDMLTKEYSNALQQDWDRIVGQNDIKRWDDEIVCMLIDRSALRFTDVLTGSLRHPRLDHRF